MRGWQFTTTHEPLRLVEQQDPTAEAGEVVIDVRAAGICHSDVSALEDPGWLAIITKRPVIMGHEISGVVSSVGQGVTGVFVGDRVGVCPSSGTRPGYSRDGGYADKTTARAKDVVRIPDNVPFDAAAAGTDAGMTAYHAVMVAGRVESGMKVGIIGLGGLGQVAAQIAVLSGAQVYAADISEPARELAAGIGVTDVAMDIGRFEALGLDVVLDFAGFGSTTAAALGAVGRRGRVVQVGMGALEATISTRTLISKRAELVGSMGGTVEDIEAVYGLLSAGQLRMSIMATDFDSIPAGIDRLRRGEVTDRLVASLSP